MFAVRSMNAGDVHASAKYIEYSWRSRAPPRESTEKHVAFCTLSGNRSCPDRYRLIARAISRTGGEPDWGLHFWIGVAAFFLLYMFHVWRDGRLTLQQRRSATPAPAKRADGRRPPVPCLRPFREDSKAQTSLTGSSSREQEPVQMLACCGPVVAVGHPEDELAPLGAARLYIDGKSWNKEVVRMMHQSCLVVIQLTATDGVLWAVETAISHVEPERLLLLAPVGAEANPSTRHFNRSQESAFRGRCHAN